MAIQPIDLQTLFTQVDKVGKAQTAQREGFAVQQEMQGILHQRKLEENIRSVNQAQDMGEGTQKVKDRGARGQKGGKRERKEGEPAPDEEEETNASVFRDPFMGRNIDISL
jgi:hypothetical protein